MFRRKLPAALALCILVLCRSVHAGDAITAEALFREGRALMDSGDFAAACPKLAESYSQDPATGTLLALGMCQESAGQSASAWATFAQVVSRAKQDGRADREAAARDRMAALLPKLSRLTLTVDEGMAKLPGFVVTRDGQPVGKAAWGTGVPLDAGEHVVEATAPGKRAWRVTVTIGGNADAQTIRVPALEDAPAAPQAVPAPAKATPADVGVSSTGTPLRTLGLVVGGVGIVGLAAGGFFGLRAKSLNDESNADDHCNARNECDATGGAKRDEASSAANTATILLIAGGALTAAGVTLFLVGGRRRTPAAASVEAAPAVGRREVAMVLRGRF